MGELERNQLEHPEHIIYTHHRGDCKGPVCSIHNRTDHHMRGFPQTWRADRGIMERVCPHGIGHPDPDDYRIITGIDEGIHGCDLCCVDLNVDDQIEAAMKTANKKQLRAALALSMVEGVIDMKDILNALTEEAR